MKSIIKYILFISLLGFASCNYLDIVPDEKPTEKDAFEDTNAAERFLYSCYGYIPSARSGTNSLDLMTGDEVVTAFEHETFASFPKGNYSASSPVISYWNTLFQGIRQCYILLNNIESVPNMQESVKADYIAQANFLIGYYHYLLIQCYGPTILVKEEPSITTTIDNYLPRTSLDECVEWVADKLEEASLNLPESRSQKQFGLATSVVAKSLRAKLYLMAASPLFNGNSAFYSGSTIADLMPLSYDANKWTKAKKAYEEAIAVAEGAGHFLFETPEKNNNLEPLDPIVRRLRLNIIEGGNKEIIWSDSRSEGYYGIQNKSLPFSSSSAWNGIAPTLAMLKRFYTKNGLPIDQDPSFNISKMFDVTTVDTNHADVADEGSSTFLFNLDREPRFYAWVGFQGGFYEILSDETNGAYAKDGSYNKYFVNATEGKKAKLVCDFVLGGNTSKGTTSSLRTNNYSPTGFLNKKGVDPGYAVKTSLQSPTEYPWPLIRLADLYLGYAEVCVETNNLAEAKTFLNKIRNRAGIPTVETSWDGIATLNQSKLREIVRQERMIEFYLENQNFWDMRRWLLAEQYFNVKVQGMNIEASTIQDFVKTKEVIFERKFNSPTQYLMPIPVEDINRNPKLVQNPGY